MSDLIIEDFKDSILKITLNNPSQQNTLSLQFINDLKKIIENADNSDEVKVIILIIRSEQLFIKVVKN